MNPLHGVESNPIARETPYLDSLRIHYMELKVTVTLQSFGQLRHPNPLHGVESSPEHINSINDRMPFIENPLHGVERFTLSTTTSIHLTSVVNPLHGVERLRQLRRNDDNLYRRRIHYMELKVGVASMSFSSLNLSGIHYMELKGY